MLLNKLKKDYLKPRVVYCLEITHELYIFELEKIISIRILNYNPDNHSSLLRLSGVTDR